MFILEDWQNIDRDPILICNMNIAQGHHPIPSGRYKLNIEKRHTTDSESSAKSSNPIKLLDIPSLANIPHILAQ